MQSLMKMMMMMELDASNGSFARFSHHLLSKTMLIDLIRPTIANDASHMIISQWWWQQLNRNQRVAVGSSAFLYDDEKLSMKQTQNFQQLCFSHADQCKLPPSTPLRRIRKNSLQNRCHCIVNKSLEFYSLLSNFDANRLTRSCGGVEVFAPFLILQLERIYERHRWTEYQ